MFFCNCFTEDDNVTLLTLTMEKPKHTNEQSQQSRAKVAELKFESTTNSKSPGLIPEIVN